ncbi:peptide deformylase [PVC group bacterium]|nr:peptide deformylase [PVC group bacterium]
MSTGQAQDIDILNSSKESIRLYEEADKHMRRGLDSEAAGDFRDAVDQYYRALVAKERLVQYQQNVRRKLADEYEVKIARLISLLSNQAKGGAIESNEFICINPVILGKSSDKEKIDERCLSFPGLRLTVSRPKSVIVEYQDPTGKTISAELEGMEARCFLHELDHLNGVTFDKKVSSLVLNMAIRRQRKTQKKEK